jgi:hypothetical protein
VKLDQAPGDAVPVRHGYTQGYKACCCCHLVWPLGALKPVWKDGPCLCPIAPAKYGLEACG